MSRKKIPYKYKGFYFNEKSGFLETRLRFDLPFVASVNKTDDNITQTMNSARQYRKYLWAHLGDMMIRLGKRGPECFGLIRDTGGSTNET